MADLAARIGHRRPLYGNLTWTRPGLEDEEKARAYQASNFGKGHRISAKHTSWDRTAMDCDSEASSSNEEDVPRAEGGTDVFSSPQTPSKPRILRNRIASGKEHTLSGTLLDRLGMSAPPEDGPPVAAGKPPQLNGAASNTEAKSTVNNDGDQRGKPASTTLNSQTTTHGNNLHSSSVRKAPVDCEADKRFGGDIPGLNLVQTRPDDNVTQSRVPLVGKLPCGSASPELVDSMRQLLVPLVIKKAGREVALSSNKTKQQDLARQANAVITDDMCEEFIRQAIASSSALKAISKKERLDHTMQGITFSTSTRQSTPTPPGLELSMAIEGTPAAAPPAAGAAESCVSFGKTMLPSHPLPTGPRSMKDKESASSHIHDDRGAGSSRSSFAYSTNPQERAMDAKEHQDRDGFRQSPRPRRSCSPESGSRRGPSIPRNHSLSHSARRPSPEWYRHDSRRPYETRGPRSPSRDYADHRSLRHRSRSRSLNRHIDRVPRSGRGPSLRGSTEREAVRQRSPSYSRREARPVRQYSPIHNSRERQPPRQEAYPYDDGEKRRGRPFSPYPSRYSRASSPRHSTSSSRAPGQTASTSRGRSPPLPPPEISSDRIQKRKSYSPIRRDGPPRGWSREPPPQATPQGPFPKKSKYEHDTVPARLNYGSHPIFDRRRRVSRDDRDFPAEGSPSKYRHICHRPPGTCSHASHRDDRRRSQSFERLPHSVSSSLHSRHERTPLAHKSEPQSEQDPRRQALPLEYSDRRGSALSRPVPSTASSLGDFAAASTSSKYHAHAPRSLATHSGSRPGASLHGVKATVIVKKERPEVHLDWSLNTRHTHDSTTAIGQEGHGVDAHIPAGDASRHSDYQHESRQYGRKDVADDLKPLGLLAAPTIIDIASGGGSNWGSSSTLIQYTPTPASHSSPGLLGQPNNDKDRKPNIKELEKLLATIQAQQRQHPLPQVPILPALQSTQPPSVAMVTLPAEPVHAMSALPTAVDVKAVAGSASPVYPSIASSRAPAAPPTANISPIRIKVEEPELELLWPVHEAQQAQAPIDTPISQMPSLPLATALPTTVAKRKRSQRRDRDRDGHHNNASQIPPASISALPSHSVIKKEPHDQDLGKSWSLTERERESGESGVTVPGVWMVRPGADSVKTVDNTFFIGNDLARECGLPSQSEYDDSSSADENAWATHEPGSTQPKVSLQLMCFSTDLLASVDHRGCGENLEALLALPQKWPMIQDLIIVSNHDTPGQRVWMSHDLPKPNGTGRPILLERYFHAGPNTLRIIHLTNLSSFTFVLVAQPNPPRDEVPSRSVSSGAADKYDDYFAKLRNNVGSRDHIQGGAKVSKPAAGSVTVLEISSDEEH